MEGWGQRLSDRDERAWCFGVAQTLTGMLTHPLIDCVIWGKLPEVFSFSYLCLVLSDELARLL